MLLSRIASTCTEDDGEPQKRVKVIVRTLQGNDFRRMLTQGIAQSTLLFTFVVALILIFLDSGFVLSVEKGAPHANITTYPIAV